MKALFNYLKQRIKNSLKKEDSIEVWKELEFNRRRSPSSFRESA